MTNLTALDRAFLAAYTGAWTGDPTLDPQPHVLLVTTLLRLALNVASTRAVLLNGHTGTAAAGQVIESFAHFLIDPGQEHHLQWVCFIDETGECWTFSNPEVRLQKNPTMRIRMDVNGAA